MILRSDSSRISDWEALQLPDEKIETQIRVMGSPKSLMEEASRDEIVLIVPNNSLRARLAASSLSIAQWLLRFIPSLLNHFQLLTMPVLSRPI